MTEQELKKELGINLKSVLDDYGISQKELSNDTGISESTISCYVNGDRLPSVKNLINIVYAIGCEFTDLISDDDAII